MSTTQTAESSAAQVVPTVTLDENDHEQLRRLGLYAALQPLREEEDWISYVDAHGLSLSDEVGKAIDKLRQGDPAGALLIRNVPLDDPLVQTPTTKALAKATLASMPVAKTALTALSEALGRMVAYQQEKETGAGGLFMPVHPARGSETAMTANSSEIDLTFHTELAFHPYRPDFVGLLCARPDQEHRAATYFATASDVVRHLSQDSHQVLTTPVLQTGLDESWGGDRLPGLLSVFEGTNSNPQMTYDLDLMSSTSPAGTKALMEMQTAAAAARRRLVLETGDLLWIDNRRAVHGRSPFTARYDGTDRLLLRGYVVRDLQPSFHDRPHHGRVIATSFDRLMAA